MAFRHRLDPPIQWAAAGSCGKLVAQGILEARDMVPQLLAAAVRAGYDGDLMGLQTRLHWEITDSAHWWGMERRAMAWRIRRRIQPMFGVAPDPGRILHAADHENHEAGEPLLWREVKAIVAAELGAWVRTNSRRTSRYV